MKKYKKARKTIKSNTFIDDGRSIADMNIEGFSWYNRNKLKVAQKNINKLNLTRKERRAMIFGALSVVLPIAGLIMILYLGAFLIVALWLS